MRTLSKGPLTTHFGGISASGNSMKHEKPDLPVSAEVETKSTIAHEDDRPVWPAIRKGWRKRCPNCGSGQMLKSYLKVRDDCPVCKQELHHHKADDGPAYLTILIVGHLMAPMLHIMFVKWRPEPLVTFTVLTVFCVALSLYLLPRMKGVIVAIQWSRRMHGFGKEKRSS